MPSAPKLRTADAVESDTSYWTARSCEALPEAQEHAHASNLRIQFPPKGAFPRGRTNVSEAALHVAVFHREITPADHTIAPYQRQRVISELSFSSRRICFETVHPAPQKLEAVAIPHHRDRRESAIAPSPAQRHARRSSSAGQYQSTPSMRACASRSVARRRHPSIRRATAAPQSADGAPDRAGTPWAAARKSGQRRPLTRPAALRRSARSAGSSPWRWTA